MSHGPGPVPRAAVRMLASLLQLLQELPGPPTAPPGAGAGPMPGISLCGTCLCLDGDATHAVGQNQEEKVPVMPLSHPAQPWHLRPGSHQGGGTVPLGVLREGGWALPCCPGTVPTLGDLCPGAGCGWAWALSPLALGVGWWLRKAASRSIPGLAQPEEPSPAPREGCTPRAGVYMGPGAAVPPWHSLPLWRSCCGAPVGKSCAATGHLVPPPGTGGPARPG